jgi:Amt family ammonium transporter
LHGGCGTWGVIFISLFASKKYVLEVYGRAVDRPYGWWRQAASNEIIEVLVITG